MARTWFPHLSGTTAEHVAGAGAAILWGVGVFQVIAAMGRRTAPPGGA